MIENEKTSHNKKDARNMSILFIMWRKERKNMNIRKYWYRRILIMVLTFTVFVGGSYYMIETEQGKLKKEVSATTSDKVMVIPGGMPIGIYLETDGVMVLGTDEVKGIDGMSYNPSKNLVHPGDYITEIDGHKVDSKAELIREIKKIKKEEVILKINRNKEFIHIKTKSVLCGVNEYKLGIWVRDNAQGLGTVTFLDTKSRFGALGHGIHDVDTNELLNIEGGRVYTTSIKDIQKGQSGMPGGMEGVIIYNNYNVLGKIQENTEAGIFGTIERIDTLFSDQTPVEVAAKEEIEEGPAVIRCAAEGKVKDYEVKITKVDLDSDAINKGIVLEVTDKELLKVTGGIVQGMSGSPILQNGKLVGAVTHVFVNNPMKGYGIFVETMLNKTKKSNS